MDTSVSTALGLVFLTLSVASVFLMYKLWGYPYNEETHTSTAPRSLTLLHRCIGYSYRIIYLIMMWHMVPRLWSYQVELPARTVAHLMLAISIGVLLLVKITIVRFCSHFSSAIPYIGTTIMLFTFLLIGLSVPFTLREHFLQSGTHVAGGNVFSDENLQRVHTLLKTAGMAEDVPVAALASKDVLREGRSVLLSKCVFCHDLRTILAKPRTPSSWVQTVQRMAIKPMLGPPLTERDQWTSSTYLIAITPDLQNSAKIRREQELERSRTVLAVLIRNRFSGGADTRTLGPN